jgi:uncharacterized membrane protein YeaQ/YmgE (transglycosylase-associated protein family)
MLDFEMITWTLVGFLAAVVARMVRRTPDRFVTIGVTGALSAWLGGIIAWAVGLRAWWTVNGYSLSALLVASAFAAASVALMTLIEHRTASGTSG